MLAGEQPVLRVDCLAAGYGAAEILHGISLRVGRGQTLCLVGPSGSGKTTTLNSIFGLAEIRGGRIEVNGRNVTRLGTNAKLRSAGIAYVPRDSSLFPSLTVEQNLWLGGNLMGNRCDVRQATERVFDRCPSLATHRDRSVESLPSGERRMLDIARALVMGPNLLLVDEPSIGADRPHVASICGLLRDSCEHERTSIVIAETNSRRGLELADIGCVLVGGDMQLVGTGVELLDHLATNHCFKEH